LRAARAGSDDEKGDHDRDPERGRPTHPPHRRGEEARALCGRIRSWHVLIDLALRRRHIVSSNEFPAPTEGFVLTHFLVVSDQDRSRDFYQSLLGGTVVLERDPVIIRIANSWLILNVGGGPTDDKPTVTLTTPTDPDRTSAFLNVRVADIQQVYADWTAKGAEFLTPPKDHGREIRAYVRDPDGHLIEVGQSVGVVPTS